MFDNEHGDSLI